jgi:hypothetical protein
MRRKWIRQFAMITPAGLLKISSKSPYDKCEYQLAGAQAVLIDGSALKSAGLHAAMFQIRFEPALQFEGAVTITFSIVSSDDIGPWVRALSRCSFAPKHGLSAGKPKCPRSRTEVISG